MWTSRASLAWLFELSIAMPDYGFTKQLITSVQSACWVRWVPMSILSSQLLYLRLGSNLSHCLKGCYKAQHNYISTGNWQGEFLSPLESMDAVYGSHMTALQESNEPKALACFGRELVGGFPVCKITYLYMCMCVHTHVHVVCSPGPALFLVCI